MTRRGLVSRNLDTTQATAVSRQTISNQILCLATSNGNTEGDPVLLGPIKLTVQEDYQRVFVAANLYSVSAYLRDPTPPPGPGSWNVTFTHSGAIDVDDPEWRSVVFNRPSGDTVITNVAWSGVTEFAVAGHQTADLMHESFWGDDESLFTYLFLYESGDEVVDNASFTRYVYLRLLESPGDTIMTVTMFDPTVGAAFSDVVYEG